MAIDNNLPGAPACEREYARPIVVFRADDHPALPLCLAPERPLASPTER